MRQLKTGLVATLAAIAATAFAGAGTASATELWKSIDWWPDETQGVGVKLQASLGTGTTSRLEDTFGFTVETCTGSELELLIEKTGEDNSSTSHPSGSFQKHSYAGCPHTSVISGGKWEIRSIPNTPNGLLISEGTEITVKPTILGGADCILKTNGTTIGTVTGNENHLGNATLDINAALTVSGAGCPTSARWKGTYTFTSFTGLYVND